MAVSRVLILLLAFLTKFGQCRRLFDDSPTYPEVSDLVLERGKPLEVQQNLTQLQIKGLSGILYSDSLSQLSQVRDLKFFFNQIRDIETGAICSPPKLRSFEIDFDHNTQAPALTKNMFEGCENLEEIFLFSGYSKFATIKEDVWQNLPNLKYLFIKNFKIKHLTQDYFKSLNSLTNLTLFRCSIEEIDSKAFGGLANLEEIRFTFNNFTHLPNNLFKNTPKLVRLVLFRNNITNLTWDEFDGLSSLEELELVGNPITTFDSNKISKYMPTLRILVVTFQDVGCSQRKKFGSEISTAMNHTLEFIYSRESGSDTCEFFVHTRDLFRRPFD